MLSGMAHPQGTGAVLSHHCVTNIHAPPLFALPLVLQPASSEFLAGYGAAIRLESGGRAQIEGRCQVRP